MPFPLPGDLPNPGIKPGLLASPMCLMHGGKANKTNGWFRGAALILFDQTTEEKTQRRRKAEKAEKICGSTVVKGFNFCFVLKRKNILFSQ